MGLFLGLELPRLTFNDRLWKARANQNAEVVLVRVTGEYPTQTPKHGKYGRRPRRLGAKSWTFDLDA